MNNQHPEKFTSFSSETPPRSPDSAVLTVTDVTRKQRTRSLTLSDGTVLTMPQVLFEKSPWRPGSPISLQAYDDWMTENEFAFAMERAGYALSSRNRSEQELRETLEHAGYRPACIERVLCHLKNVGYIDDAAFAKAWISHRTAGGYGKNRIRQELHMKGIRDDLLSELLNEPQDEDAELAGIRSAAEKAARGKDLSAYKDRQKVRAALARRGFDFDLIDLVISRMADATEEDEW